MSLWLHGSGCRGSGGHARLHSLVFSGLPTTNQLIASNTACSYSELKIKQANTYMSRQKEKEKRGASHERMCKPLKVCLESVASETDEKKFSI